MASRKQRLVTILTWTITLFTALGLGMAGLAKLPSSETWQGMFESWGYAPWFSTLVGVLELVGALALLAPKLTAYAACGLVVIMLGALYTVLTNDTTLGPVTPIIHLVLLSTLIRLRWGTRMGWHGRLTTRAAALP